MKTKLTTAALAAALTITSAYAQETTPDSVKTRIGDLTFERGFPSGETKQKVFDEIDYQRAVQAYLWGDPAVSFESIRLAAKASGMDLNEIGIADKYAAVGLSADVGIDAETNVSPDYKPGMPSTFTGKIVKVRVVQKQG